MENRVNRTADALAEAATAKLKIGDKVQVHRYAKDKASKAIILVEVRKGRVIEMNKHIFVLKIGNHREAFRYGQVFNLEEERVIL